MSDEKKYTFQELAKAVAYIEFENRSLREQLHDVKMWWKSDNPNDCHDIEAIHNQYEKQRAALSPHSFKHRADEIVKLFIKSRTYDIDKGKK